jgi:hypothetical protein
MRYIPNAETLALLDYVEDALPLWRFEPRARRPLRPSEIELPTRELATIRARLLRLNALLAELELEGIPLYTEANPSRFDWLTYLEEVKIIPIYDDAIAVMRHRTLVNPQEVPHLLRFTSVNGSNYGVDKSENHGHGYHFHFGKVKKNALNRVNVVLTFDHRKPVPPNSHDPLFAEEHGSGRYDHIDVATVGKNVRLPVYRICESEMLSLGRQKFKTPAAKASIFY